jgi:hypothetical protein
MRLAHNPRINAVVYKMYDQARTAAKGDRLKGRARWVNHPHGRSDGVWLPNVHGVIQTEDGASVLFSLRGRTSFVEGSTGRQLLAVIFETGDERYRWLNETLCVFEGVIDASAQVFNARVFQCINELV